MKFPKFVFQMLVIVVLLSLVAFLTASTLVVQPALQDAPVSPLSAEDVAVSGFIAWAVGWIISYALNTFAWLRDLFDKVPSGNKPVLLAFLYVIGAIGLGLLTCTSIYTTQVACPTAPVDYIRLVFLGLVAWASSQTAHATGGKQLAAQARYRVAGITASPPNTKTVG